MKKLYRVILTALLSPARSRRPNDRYRLPGKWRTIPFFSAGTGAQLSADSWDETEPLLMAMPKSPSTTNGDLQIRPEEVAIAPVPVASPFVNGLAAAMQGGKWDLSMKGATVIPFQYDIVYDYREA